MKPSTVIWRWYNGILEVERQKHAVPTIQELPHEVRNRAAFAAILLFLDAHLGDVGGGEAPEETADPKEPPTASES